MASEENTQPADADTLKIMNPKLYQMLVKRGVRDHRWAEYFLLISTCYEVIKRVPATPEACNEIDIDKLMNDALERIGKARWDVLPGGAEEFSYYMPDSIRKEKAQAKHQMLILSQLEALEND